MRVYATRVYICFFTDGHYDENWAVRADNAWESLMQEYEIDWARYQAHDVSTPSRADRRHREKMDRQARLRAMTPEDQQVLRDEIDKEFPRER